MVLCGGGGDSGGDSGGASPSDKRAMTQKLMEHTDVTRRCWIGSNKQPPRKHCRGSGSCWELSYTFFPKNEKMELPFGSVETTNFRRFTPESLVEIEKRIAAKRAAKKAKEKHKEQKDHKEKPRPQLDLKACNQLPKFYGELPAELVGEPLEDLDSFYSTHRTFMVLNKGRTISRFSATRALCLFSPFNLIRRTAIRVSVHSYPSHSCFFYTLESGLACCYVTSTWFSLFITVTILANCACMTQTELPERIEYVFTVIYTFEALIKILARGFCLNEFTYLRDPWNWLDFSVIILAAGVSGERQLPGAWTGPGLKVIVRALIHSVRKLADVTILTVFCLSVFALVGLQLFKGNLKNKCVKNCIALNGTANSSSYRKDEWNPCHPHKDFYFKKNGTGDPLLCGNGSDAGRCPTGYLCLKTSDNPDFNYTSFDSFAWAFLSLFRLMTQDSWERLYQQTLRASGKMYMIFFVLVIFLGSFYLVNLILAVVTMAYEEQNQATIDMIRKKQEVCEGWDLAAVLSLQVLAALGIDTTSLHSHSGSPLGSQNAREQTHRMKPRVSEGSIDDNRSPQSDPYTQHTKASAQDQSFLGRASGTRRASHDSVFHFRAPGQDISLPEEATDDGVFLGDSGSHRGSLLLGGGAGQQGPLPGSPLPQPSTPGSAHREGQPALPIRELAPGVADVSLPPTYGRRFQALEAACAHPGAQVPALGQELAELWQVDAGPKKAFLSAEHLNEPFRAQRAMSVVSIMTSVLEGESCSLGCVLWLRLAQKYLIWECCPTWMKLKTLLFEAVTDPFSELAITLCIVVNTIFMAMEHHGMSLAFETMLQIGNIVFTMFFTAEMVFKIIAFDPYYYFQKRWNIFDCIIVTVSLIELGAAKKGSLSVLRTFRLLRVFKLAKSWPTLNTLIKIIGNAVGALGNLTVILAIIVFIFALVGKQILGENYRDFRRNISAPGEEWPRWHMVDFFHSFLIVFRILCGEWIENMWACMEVGQKSICLILFLTVLVLGNLVVLNLFIALLLNSFSADSLAAPEDDGEMHNLHVALARIRALGRCSQKALQSTTGWPRLLPWPKTEPQLVVKLSLSSSKAENTGAASTAGESPERPPSPRDATSDNGDFITNPNIWVSVPIAEGEPDLDAQEDDGEEEAGSSSQEGILRGWVSVPMRQPQEAGRDLRLVGWAEGNDDNEQEPLAPRSPGSGTSSEDLAPYLGEEWKDQAAAEAPAEVGM
ncbi:hypothetical protein MC885_005761 [Smutsia gigantea]|nr:hypothetical protein MC885_005761 [Smutsia gigantea]